MPVYISLDPAHDRPEDLRTAAGRSRSPTMLVVTGPPDGLLGAAERFKNTEEARRAVKTLDAHKRAGEAAAVRGYVSDNMYVVDPAGRIVAMIPKNARPGDLAGMLATEVGRTAASPPMIP